MRLMTAIIEIDGERQTVQRAGEDANEVRLELEEEYGLGTVISVADIGQENPSGFFGA